MKLLRALGFLFLFSFGATIFWVQISSPDRSKENIRIEVASGEDLQSIAETLKEHGLIRSTILFRMYLKSRGIDRDMKSGTFLIVPGSTFATLSDLLIGLGVHETVVTIPEGYTIAQVDALLTEMGLIADGELLHCARTCDFLSFAFLPPSYSGGHGGWIEGYIFPDTYFVSAADFVPKFFLERLLSTFQKKITEGLSDDLAESKRSLHELVTMASLIERETRSDEERPIVSGILWKRFDAERGLDVDASVRYGLQKLSGPLTKEDLQNRNAYNTRRHVGLPPGPIASPGLESLKAALEPKATEYWYYLHGEDGKIHYAESNEEHNSNKAKYL